VTEAHFVALGPDAVLSRLLALPAQHEKNARACPYRTPRIPSGISKAMQLVAFNEASSAVRAAK